MILLTSSDNLNFWWNSCLLTGIYLFKVKDRNPRTRCEICSKMTERRRSGDFIVNFEHISHLVLVLLLLNLNMSLPAGLPEPLGFTIILS